jgi:hypothetical protein
MTMTPDELTVALEQLPPMRIAEQSALAAAVRHDTTALAARAVALAGASSAQLAFNARSIAGELEELAVSSLLSAPPTASVAEDVWRIRTAVAAAVALRARVAAYLRSLLADRRLTPLPTGVEGLAHAPPPRVCDEAYVALRELINLEESRSGFTLDRWAFLRLSDAEKDAEIAAVLSGAPFVRLIEDAQV